MLKCYAIEYLRLNDDACYCINPYFNTLISTLKHATMNQKTHYLQFLALSAFLCMFFNGVIAQKQFAVTVKLPPQLDTKKLSVLFDDGKSENRISNPVIKNNAIHISQPYYGQYAAIILRYPEPDRKLFNYYRYFFVAEKPATITLLPYDSAQSPFDHYQLSNACDFKSEQEQMHQYDSVERKELDDYNALINEGKTGAANDSIAQAKGLEKFDKWNKKDLEFIRKYPDSYYSFWFFRRYLMQSDAATPDSLLSIYNTIFPAAFKNSEEGNTIVKVLKGRIGVHKNGTAPDFTGKDSSGKMVALKDYLGKKNVLLVFWATWCVPCMQEVPAIKEIRNQYSAQQLEIISVALPSDYATFARVTKEKGMNWINIYNDADIINSYNANNSIPRVYLIDKSGTIVYDKNEDEDLKGALELVALKKLLQSDTIN